MKRYNLLLLFVGIMTVLFSCDIVEEPFMNQIVQPPDTDEVVQRVLLEEFTGHQCPNCPAGAQIASQLGDLYGKQFIVIAYHVGFFANTNSNFPVNYKTQTGEEIKDHFGVISYPSGLVNRKNGEVLGSTEWASVVAEQASATPKLKLKINREYNSTSRVLSVTANLTALETMESVNVCVFLTESGLVSPQKTKDDPDYPEGIIPNYNHKHVFRASMNGTWGSTVFADGAHPEDTATVNAEYTINSDWNAENMSIVCFAYSTTSGEIVQVEEVDVK
ncbi:MAG: Omp28 family outer membrane lipoprotein [Tenuifilaceae bacterium]|jgi:thiol-disulfide isomerase/thioredoxin|nr:Omp28 family outer membrane lipoprotein [Bacteroidales bacterium]MDI9516806.1 Omp28 family outer membrane lipoprotein [Bacteroidota bacterium]NLH57353.1 Omp28 family outer membrane lipoprotein [Rikenellaceae bacterium]OQC64696.1 MAG: Outer membrane protein Omp28 [Bacteroidetes bacterium ADurb.Bin008]HNV81032.1 Omp28 family outer membrane lipoprotein [Tenuifilaceae bacterium]